jgi:hypothetical protein
VSEGAPAAPAPAPGPTPPPAPATPAPKPPEEEAVSILAAGLNDAMVSLAKLATSSNKRNARQAVAILHRYLNSPNAITATLALGADAAAAHLNAIAWLEQRQAELETPTARCH